MSGCDTNLVTRDDLYKVKRQAQFITDVGTGAPFETVTNPDTKISVPTIAEAIRRVGFETPVPYAAGLLMERVTQTVYYNNDVYHAINVPFTTSGTFETDKFMLLRSVTTSDLSDSYFFETETSLASGTKLNGETVVLSENDIVSVLERGSLFKFKVEQGVPNGLNKINVSAGLVATLITLPNEAISITAYGAKMDNATDIGPFVNAMIADGLTPIIPPGQALLNTVVNIVNNGTIILQNPIIRTDQIIPMFLADSVDDWVILGAAQLLGSVPGGQSAQIGIKSVGCLRYRVENIVAKNMLGHGFLIGHDGTIANRGEHGQWNNCAAYGSYVGWEFEDGTSSEYTVLTGCSALLNIRGVVNGAGNTNWNGGNIVDNTIGVELYGGNNDNHGIFSGVNINHNTQRNIEATGVANGYTFDGCHFYASGPVANGTGKIVIANSKQFNFNGGTLACPVEVFKGSNTSAGTNVFKNMYVNVDSWTSFSGDALSDLVSQGHWSDTGMRTDLIYPGSVPITTFQNGWSNYENGRSDLAFTLGENGTMQLSGTVKGGTSSFATVIATLPPKYAPDLTHDFIVDTGDISNPVPGFIQIEAVTGNITWRSGDVARVSLTGLNYPIKGGDA